MTASLALADARHGRQLDRLEIAALAYLLAPLPLFVATWLRWPTALALLALLGVSAWPVIRAWRRGPVGAPGLPIWLWGLIGVTALAWVGSSGLLGGVPLNDDWRVRMVVLRDLAVGAWPVSYGPDGSGESVLRFSLGYYLVPAAIGQLGGVSVARIALGGWTVVGVILFFALACAPLEWRRPRLAAAALSVLVLYSGMDVLGWWLAFDKVPAFAQHLEWWANYQQYSSQTTLLLWAPNHALPAWLAATIAWRHRAQGLALAHVAMLMLACALWSPLATLGLLPIALAVSLRGQTLSGWLRDAISPAVLAVLPLTLVLARFVSFGLRAPTQGATEHFATQVEMLVFLVPLYLQFALVEWAVLAWLLSRAVGGWRRLPALLWVGMAELVLLPVLLRFGPGNDAVMRGGIGPMVLLTLATATVLTQQATPARWRWAMAAVLAVGAVTPLTEWQRATLPGSQFPDDGRSLVQQFGAPWHYVGLLQEGWMQQVLRPPVRLPAHAEPVKHP